MISKDLDLSTSYVYIDGFSKNEDLVHINDNSNSGPVEKVVNKPKISKKMKDLKSVNSTLADNEQIKNHNE